MHARDMFLYQIQTNPRLTRASRQYVTGSPSTEYISDETPMVAYGNVHLALEQLRVRAACKLHGSPTFENPNQETSAEPPRVLVLGPEHSGKTTVSKLLVNYCTRVGQGWAPVLVNVDPSEVRSFHAPTFLLVL